MTFILYGLLLAHLNSYREYYARMGATFAATFVLKKLIKTVDKDNADLIGLGGYALTGGEFFKMINAMKSAGFARMNSEDTNKIIGGLFGNGTDLIKKLLEGK